MVGALAADVGHVAKVFDQFAIGCSFQGNGLTIELSAGVGYTGCNHLVEAFRLLNKVHHDASLADNFIKSSIGVVLFLVTQKGVLVGECTVLIELLGIVAARLVGKVLRVTLNVGTSHVGCIEKTVAEHFVLCSISP